MRMDAIGTIMEAAAGMAARMTVADALGYLGVVLSIAASSMKTMIPLRCMGILCNLTFILYGFLAAAWPPFLTHLVLLPLNLVRLGQMTRLIREVKRAAAADHAMEWLKPFMSKREVRAGDVLFRKGDEASCMYYVLGGRFRLRESAIELAEGQFVGELGLLAPDNRRTQTLECRKGGAVLAISYDELRQLYFQNPEFGFYFLRLTSGRLFDNIAALEAEVERLRAAEPRLAVARA